MEEVTFILDTLSRMPVFWAYVMVATIAYLENIIPPIPGDLVLVYGGYLAGVGVLEWWWVGALGTLASTAGFMTLFMAGQRWGERRLFNQKVRWVSFARMVQAREWMHKRGYWIIVFNRFLAGTRAVIALVAGASGLDVRRASVLSFVSAAGWTAILVALGFLVGDNLNLVKRWLTLYGQVVLGVLVGGILLRLLFGFLWKRLTLRRPSL